VSTIIVSVHSLSVSTLWPYGMKGSECTEQRADRYGSTDQLFKLIQSGWVPTGLRSSYGLRI